MKRFGGELDPGWGPGIQEQQRLMICWTAFIIRDQKDTRPAFVCVVANNCYQPSSGR
jgi:hypothetical protein